MTRRYAVDATLQRGSAALALLLLSACSQGYVAEPWTHNDPQWKQMHFESQTPRADLQERAALTQVDR